MKFTPIASGSSGNAYLLRSDPCSVAGGVLIELGIPWKKILSAIEFKASRLDFAITSHSHFDHSHAVRDAIKAGIDVYMSAESAETLKVLGHHRVNILKAGEQKRIGLWTVLSFDCVHDVPTLGFLIGQDEERLLFIPDTAYVKNRFIGITIAAIECNFINNILSENIQKGLPPIVGHRVRRNHMSLETLIEMLKCNDLSRCQAIYLLHLSDGNADEKRMIKEVQEAVGIPTYSCT